MYFRDLLVPWVFFASPLLTSIIEIYASVGALQYPLTLSPTLTTFTLS